MSQLSNLSNLKPKPDLASKQELTQKHEEIGLLKRSLKATRDEWTQIWNSCQKQLRLARWDVEDAKEKVGTWHKKIEMEQVASFLKDGKVTPANEEIGSRYKLALAKLERAEEQDTLYREIESHADLDPANTK